LHKKYLESFRSSFVFSDNQMIETDIPIITKRVVHTGANTQLGGFKGDLLIVVYQPFTAGAVNKEPIIPAIWQTNMNTMYVIVLLFFISKLYYFWLF